MFGFMVIFYTSKTLGVKKSANNITDLYKFYLKKFPRLRFRFFSPWGSQNLILPARDVMWKILCIVLITIKFEIPPNLPEHHTAHDHHWQRAWGEVQKPTVSRNFSNRHQNVPAQNPSQRPWSRGKWWNCSAGGHYMKLSPHPQFQIDKIIND